MSPSRRRRTGSTGEQLGEVRDVTEGPEKSGHALADRASRVVPQPAAPFRDLPNEPSPGAFRAARSVSAMLHTLRSLWAWFAIGGLVVAGLPLVALVRLFDRDPARYATGRMFRRVGAAMTRVNPAWRVRVEGAFPADPRRPYVVVSNHQSNADIPVISRLPWEMKWVGKAELFRIPIAGWMMRLAGDLAVDRGEGRSRAAVLVKARDVLARRCSVMFFPEGTRSKDGRVLPFTDGAFRLAIKAGVPVLPLAVEGTMGALPKHDWRFGTADIRLAVLPPVSTDGLTAADTVALRERVRALIADRVATWRGTDADAVLAPEAAVGGEESAERAPRAV